MLALKGLGAGDGLLVEGMPGIVVGVGEIPPGEKRDGTVPARARRNTGGNSGWRGGAAACSGKSPDCGDSGMMFSRSRRDEDDEGELPEDMGPQGFGAATPSSTWISRALLQPS